MSWIYKRLIRPALFTQPSEPIHDRTLDALSLASRSCVLTGAARALYGAPELPVELFGLRFPNPVGLAAGMDKQAAAVPMWEAMGFGFSELGGVTWHGQPGNPQPRMFRAISEEALVNRMGFNNPGAESFCEQLIAWKRSGKWPAHPVGVNLGKSKITPLEEATDDYLRSFKLLRPHADFFVVNVSSPNTPNLRQLQDKSALDEIFTALQEANTPDEQAPAKPILVKVAPDLSFDALDEIVELVEPRNIAGIVGTNTTIGRPKTGNSQSARSFSETGGLSGRPLRGRSTEIVRHLHRQTSGRVPIIGVGGIFTADDAWEKIRAGASLLQIYSGMVYEGPSITRRIVGGLIERMEREGFRSLKEAVGTA